MNGTQSLVSQEVINLPHLLPIQTNTVNANNWKTAVSYTEQYLIQAIATGNGLIDKIDAYLSLNPEG